MLFSYIRYNMYHGNSHISDDFVSVASGKESAVAVELTLFERDSECSKEYIYNIICYRSIDLSSYKYILYMHNIQSSCVIS